MSYLDQARQRLATVREGRQEATGGQVTPSASASTRSEISDQSDESPLDPLGEWLALPVPRHCEPPTDALTVPDIETLQDRITDYLAAGEQAIAQVAPDDPRVREALRRMEGRREALDALGDLLGALTGEWYDRGRLARWTAAQYFLDGDMAAVLQAVDAAGAGASDG